MILAEISAEGYAIIISAGCVGVGGVAASIITLIIGFKERKDQRGRDDAKVERDRIAAEKVEAVRVQAKKVETDLAATRDETHGKLNRIIRVQDGQTERLMRLLAEKDRREADRTGNPADAKMASDAEAELAAHIAGMAAQNKEDKKGGVP